MAKAPSAPPRAPAAPPALPAGNDTVAGAESAGVAVSETKANSLDYDEGYNLGYRSGSKGVDGRDPAATYSDDFKAGFTAGRNDALDNKAHNADVRTEGEVANEREQAEVDAMSVEDRLRRIERSLGFRSPSVTE